MSASHGDDNTRAEEVEEEDRRQHEKREGLSDGQKKIIVLAGATETAVSFQIEKEDHTLGNSLRYFIQKNPDVEFCGYTIPHPSETKMNLRIQTYENSGTSAHEALDKGLDDLIEACDVVSEKFTTARDEFEESRQ